MLLCPNCGHKINVKKIMREMGSKGGKSTSEAKSNASRENGKKGGRPRKDENKD